MKRTLILLTAASALLVSACQNPERVAPAADVPVMGDDNTVIVGPDQTRPATAEEKAVMRQQGLAQERANVEMTRVFTGEHCVVYSFKINGNIMLFAEGYRESGGAYPAMSCSVARG